MRSIDIHAHLVPQGVWQAAAAGRDWYGYRHEPGEGLGSFVGDGKRTAFSSPKVRFTTEERLKDMDAQSCGGGPSDLPASPRCRCRTWGRR